MTILLIYLAVTIFLSWFFAFVVSISDKAQTMINIDKNSTLTTIGVIILFWPILIAIGVLFICLCIVLIPTYVVLKISKT